MADIQLPDGSPYQYPGQYLGIVLGAVDDWLKEPSLWAVADYADAVQRMEEMKAWLVERVETVGAIVGEVRFVALSVAPDGWLVCDGSDVEIEAYPLLWEVIGYNFSNDAPEGYFTLPDLRYRTPVGTGSLDGSGQPLGLAEKIGEKTVTLTVDQMPAHSHGLRIGQNAGSAAHPHTNNNMAATATTYNPLADTGGGQSHNNLSPGLGLLPIIYPGG